MASLLNLKAMERRELGFVPHRLAAAGCVGPALAFRIGEFPSARSRSRSLLNGGGTSAAGPAFCLSMESCMVSTSLWMETEILPEAGALKGDAHCDVAVVGSGIAGLSTAYELSKRGQSAPDRKPLAAADNLWPDQALIWEATRNHHYARTTSDGRIIFGGEDDHGLIQPDARDAATPTKVRVLKERLRTLWPRTSSHVAFAWSGAFDTTRDGLPLIGAVPGSKNIFAAFGYGGNGITFSLLAAELIGSLLSGGSSPCSITLRSTVTFPASGGRQGSQA
jgi:FAD dependent oxidoreductase